MAAHCRNRRPAGAKACAVPASMSSPTRVSGNDQQVAAAPVAGGEERAVQAEAGQAHHGGAGYAGRRQERLDEPPEPV
jgi:hypothetical protein